MRPIYSPASQVLERISDELEQRKVLFAGDIQDDFVVNLTAKQINIHTTAYHHYCRLLPRAKGQITFSVVPEAVLFEEIDTLIYYWPKTKLEAQFQLSALLSQLAKGVDVFIVGENRAGVRSAETLLSPFGRINKIDSARRCSLYHFQADSRLAFDLAEWWQRYQLDNGAVIKNLPGVFSSNHLDVGSELLLQALLPRTELLHGHILDMGCGAGVLATVIGLTNPAIELTLSDVNAVALRASEETLQANHLTGQVVASDVFSDIKTKFDLIISNPPFHDGKEISYFAAETLISEAKKFLKPNGHLCIVANAFLPYPDLLDKAFGSHQIVLQTNKFKVYLARYR
ncbi:16S rRNA (guanine(1207)-N(2))-methyltransferase RsmC [Utexia brackfieldae]|uniref:16S rRNA (guanine(1207)-N(2))-methyltransferase RsmC n=1 Tax=Utexia brackfieldae TaxID=3074108 RepID=UPI00370D3432